MKRLTQILPYLLSGFFIVLSTHISYAATTDSYIPLAPIADVGSPVNTSDPTAFVNYVNDMYKAAILIAGVLAVVMITIGGIEYMGSESGFSKEQGKKKISDAIIGLILLVSCFLILNTINPQLLCIKVFSSTSNSNCPSATSASPSEAAGTAAENVTTTFSDPSNGSITNSNTGGIAPLTGGTQLRTDDTTSGNDPEVNIYPTTNSQTSDSNPLIDNSPGDLSGNAENGDGDLPQ